MSEFSAKNDLAEIKARRTEAGFDAHERLDELKQNIAVSREVFADAFNEITDVISNDDQVSRKELLEIVEKYAKSMDKDTEMLFYEGIAEYMNVRRSLKTHLAKVGKKGVLKEIAVDYLADPPDDDTMTRIDDVLKEVAKHADIEIGPVNYNIFITPKDAEKLVPPEENANDWRGISGQSSISWGFPCSLIFNGGEERHSTESLLLRAVFGERLQLTPEAQKTVEHENRHQIDAFVEHLLRQDSDSTDIYATISSYAKRRRRLAEFGAPNIILENEDKRLLQRIQTISGMEDIGSLQEVPESFWQKVDTENTKRILNRALEDMKTEVVAFLLNGYDRQQIKNTLEKRYLPKHLFGADDNDAKTITENWQKGVDKAFEVVEQLEGLGYTTKQVLAMLSPMKLSQWSGVARRQKVAKGLGRTSVRSSGGVE
ncbi:MAG: hypothetical protein LBQ02_00650 [Candidatus Nomurabacteria bacterium]|jgi:hypothetical protein|nr:hypothetical protein [Candidatus Nomurabacteria bacterium]